MSVSAREAAMRALVSRLSAGVGADHRVTLVADLASDVTLLINGVPPAIAPDPPPIEREDLPADTLAANGRIVVWQVSFEATPVFSPLSYACELGAEVEVFVPGDDVATRAERIDLLLRVVSEVLAADRTLGGAVEWTEVAAATVDVEQAGASAPVHVASLPLTLFFTAANSPQG